MKSAVIAAVVAAVAAAGLALREVYEYARGLVESGPLFELLEVGRHEIRNPANGGVLRTVTEARAYMIALPALRETRQHWQHAAALMMAEADVGDLTQQLHLALFPRSPARLRLSVTPVCGLDSSRSSA